MKSISHLGSIAIAAMLNAFGATSELRAPMVQHDFKYGRPRRLPLTTTPGAFGSPYKRVGRPGSKLARVIGRCGLRRF